MSPVITVENLAEDCCSFDIWEILSAFGIQAAVVALEKEPHTHNGTCYFMLNGKADLKRAFEFFNHLQYCGRTLKASLLTEFKVLKQDAA